MSQFGIGAMRDHKRAARLLVLLTLLLLATAQAADAATPIHVCGIVTEYFVSDIPSGGLIEIDGKQYPIASSASYPRAAPLPDVAVGSRICLDGTIDESGRLLDFTISPLSSASPAASPSAATPSAAGTTRPLAQAETPWPLIVAGALVAVVVLATALVLGARIARR